MKFKEPGSQKARHIMRIGELSSTARRSNSPAQSINQCLPSDIDTIRVGKVFPVCGNTWSMLHDSRFRPHFDFIGDFSQHYGLFEGCGAAIPFDATAGGSVLGCC